MKSFRKYLAEALSEDEYVKRNLANQEVLKELNEYYYPMERIIQDIRNIAIHGGHGKIKDNSKELVKCCKGIIEATKKLQEMS